MFDTLPHAPSPQADALPDSLPFEQRPEAAVLTAAPAPVLLAWAEDQLARHWRCGGRLQALSGERDVNLCLDRDDGSRWLFKVSHPVEDPVATDFQTQALRHLARVAPELPVQRLAPSAEGAWSVQVEAPDGRPRVLRLISWLEGLPMPQARLEIGRAHV